MILESYVLALLGLINNRRITLEDIKNEEYKNAVLLRSETQ